MVSFLKYLITHRRAVSMGKSSTNVTLHFENLNLVIYTSKTTSQILPVAGLGVGTAGLLVVGGFIHGVKDAVKNQFRKTINRDIL